MKPPPNPPLPEESMRHTYRLEWEIDGVWRTFVGDAVGREYGRGFLEARRGAPGPRLGCRLVRSDGRVIEEVPALADVSIGAVVGWPTAEEYRAAARRALHMADLIERRGPMILHPLPEPPGPEPAEPPGPAELPAEPEPPAEPPEPPGSE